MAAAEGQPPSGGKQAARMATRVCLASALTEDARLGHVGIYAPYVVQLSSEITGVAASVVGQCIFGGCVEQLFLRREEGGVGVGDPICFGLRARAAAVIERGPALRAARVELAPQSEGE